MPDKSLIAVCIAGTLIFILFVFLFIFFVVMYRNRLNQHYLEKQALLVSNIEERERMMNQIAKEVHDNIGQLSQFLIMTIKSIQNSTDREKQQRLLDSAAQLAEVISTASENISHSLNSDFIMARGLCNIIQDDVQHIRASGKIVCNIDFEGEIRPLDPDRELIIYRIAQEAIHNTLKHAHASAINIQLTYCEDGFKMEIKDNGRGFNTEDTNKKKGIGLNNMKERAKLLKGEIAIYSKPGDGCTITLSCPL